MQKTTTTIKQTAKLSPQQIMVASMIQASSEDLQKLIDEELEKNIALESDDSRSVDQMTGDSGDDDQDAEAETTDYDADTAEESEDDAKDNDVLDDYYDEESIPGPDSNSDSASFSPITNYGSDLAFRDALKDQLSMLEIDERELFIAKYIIDSLEDDGYLRRSAFELVDDLEFQQNFVTTEEEVERVLVEVVQANVEPAGIGARDLRECMLLQLLDKKSTDAVQNAYRIVDEAFSELSARRFDKIKARFGLSDREMADAQKILQHLNPKPGGITSNTEGIEIKASHVRPDFIVTNEDGILVVSLCDSHVPSVRISQDYNEMLERIQKEKSDSEDVQKGKAMIEDGIRSANLFINALVQRRNTLIAVMRVIVSIQHDYFLTGKIESLQPMTLKKVAEISGYDISTISRVSNSRYVLTDFGTFPLKDLFTTAVSTDSGSSSVSNAAIKTALKEIVDNEDKSNPLNDDELVKRLSEMGYTIARRTVSKYREALGINKANLRRQ